MEMIKDVNLVERWINQRPLWTYILYTDEKIENNSNRKCQIHCLQKIESQICYSVKLCEPINTESINLNGKQNGENAILLTIRKYFSISDRGESSG